MTGCSKEQKSLCNKEYMLIYYKLILFYQSYRIIKFIFERAFIQEKIKSLFQDDLNKISDEDLKKFFNYFINEHTYSSSDYDIPDLTIKEKMHLFFHHYILFLIKDSNPDIISKNATENEYGPKLHEIFKKIFNGDIIL